jgi:hypothetical protein
MKIRWWDRDKGADTRSARNCEVQDGDVVFSRGIPRGMKITLVRVNEIVMMLSKKIRVLRLDPCNSLPLGSGRRSSSNKRD